MGLLSKLRSPKRHVAIWDPALSQFELKWLSAPNYNVVEDKFLKKAYEIGPNIRSVTFKIKNKVIGIVPIVDESRGVGVNLEPDESLIKIKTTPELLGHMIDAVMIKNAYALTPSMKSIIIAALAALLFGILIGHAM